MSGANMSSGTRCVSSEHTYIHFAWLFTLRSFSARILHFMMLYSHWRKPFECLQIVSLTERKSESAKFYWRILYNSARLHTRAQRARKTIREINRHNLYKLYLCRKLYTLTISRTVLLRINHFEEKTGINFSYFFFVAEE